MTLAAPLPALALVDRSDRTRLCFDGEKAAATLTGLVTNDLLALTDGQGQYACALTPKGKIIADVRVLAVGAPVTTLHVDTNAAAGPGFVAMIRKYVNPRLAKYADVTAATRTLTLVGAAAHDAARTVLGDGVTPLAGAARWSHVTVPFADATVRVVVSPELGDTPCLDLVVDVAAHDALHGALLGAGATVTSTDAFDAARIVAGWPAWGVDMDESTIPQEAEMDALQAISYEKGCYTGQETVARIHFRGHVNRHLRRVVVSEVAALPARGSELLAPDEDKPVGDLRSLVALPDGTIAGLAMVRREIEPGAVVRIAGGGVAHISALVR